MTRHKIAFVDGDEGFLAGLRRMLDPLREKWDMRFFNRPADALEAAETDPFDVVVSEISLPGMDVCGSSTRCALAVRTPSGSSSRTRRRRSAGYGRPESRICTSPSRAPRPASNDV